MDCPEEVPLVAEVVVERPARQPCPRHDLLGTDRGVTPFCVIPDLPLGSHREAMQPDADLSPAGLARLVADFLAALDLTGVTSVGNDTGGAIWLASRLLRSSTSRWVFGLLAATPIPRSVHDGWAETARRDPGVRRDTGKVLRGITTRESMRAIAVLRSFDRPVLLAWGRDDAFFRS